jgi:saccharopine dehydrogenase-like NADP-dependent oxidoreductase
LYNKFGTTKIQVGLPAAVGAILCAEKKVPTGVIAPEAVDPNIFMDKFERIGFPIDFEIETIR